jgi:hypothetical protein
MKRFLFASPAALIRIIFFNMPVIVFTGPNAAHGYLVPPVWYVGTPNQRAATLFRTETNAGGRFFSSRSSPQFCAAACAGPRVSASGGLDLPCLPG